MKRLLGIGLSLAVVGVFLLNTVTFIVHRDWGSLLLWGMILMLWILIVRLSLENQRLKKQIRELELGLAL
jgi:hypothetical protein